MPERDPSESEPPLALPPCFEPQRLRSRPKPLRLLLLLLRHQHCWQQHTNHSHSHSNQQAYNQPNNQPTIYTSTTMTTTTTTTATTTTAAGTGATDANIRNGSGLSTFSCFFSKIPCGSQVQKAIHAWMKEPLELLGAKGLPKASKTP